VIKRLKIFEAMQPVVWLGSAGLVLAFCIYGGFFPASAASVFGALQTTIASQFGWFYILSASFFFFFVIWLCVSPYGNIRLGGDQAQPDFSYFAWFTMLFSAGMGIGLIFWSIAEPIMHYGSPPMANPETREAAAEALRFTFFHWGFHPWAVYVIFALGIAYYHFRFKLPLAPRSLLYPIIGERCRGYIGHLVDILCTVGTLFGVATSLGIGAMQINTGLSEYTDLAVSTEVQVWIIILVTLVATVSVVSGINRGIKLLSQFNILLALAFMVFLIMAGLTLYQLRMLTTTVGDYLQNVVGMSFWMGEGKEASWQQSWTIFYWGWWISWAPFVGIFIARISKGRTVREFVLNVFLAPVAVTFVWLAVFGGTGLHMELHGAGGIAEAVSENAALSLNAVLANLPFSSITPAIATLLVVTFFVTSSDSGSLVNDMVTSGGHPNPPRSQRIFWAFAEGIVAIVLLSSGGLIALQTASIASGLPITILLLFTCYGLVKAFRVDDGMDGVPGTHHLANGPSPQAGDAAD